MSECLAARPAGWVNRWAHNELGFYDSPQLAWSVSSGTGDISLFAYRLLAQRFVSGSQEPLEVPAVAPEEIHAPFVTLGFDVVSRSDSAFFECSPLSCNGLAAEIAVNRYCLLDSLRVAIEFARRCSMEQPEPGSYFVFEVSRSRQR